MIAADCNLIQSIQSRPEITGQRFTHFVELAKIGSFALHEAIQQRHGDGKIKMGTAAHTHDFYVLAARRKSPLEIPAVEKFLGRQNQLFRFTQGRIADSG